MNDADRPTADPPVIRPKLSLAGILSGAGDPIHLKSTWNCPVCGNGGVYDDRAGLHELGGDECLETAAREMRRLRISVQGLQSNIDSAADDIANIITSLDLQLDDIGAEFDHDGGYRLTRP